MIWVTSSLAAWVWFKKHKSGSCLKFYWKHVPDVTRLTHVASREKAVRVQCICSKCQGLGREGGRKGAQAGDRSGSTRAVGPPRAAWGLLAMKAVGLPGSWGFGFCRAPGGLQFSTSKGKGSKENFQATRFLAWPRQSDGGFERKLLFICVCYLYVPVLVSMGRDCCLIQHDLKLVWLLCFWKAALCISVSPLTVPFCSSSCSPPLWEYSSLGSFPWLL